MCRDFLAVLFSKPMLLVSVHSNTSTNNNTLLKNILNGLFSALKGLNEKSPADTNLNTLNALK